ncbi:MAG: DEAD/DEAH box helicase [Clostridium beijerinckii]|jgi:ATP-dependent DNA helicase RecQ|nr:DEAD/DEAH box helicase [Clostridium beijerinckii]MCI1583478.1 DEAD/DEAH box helicase [Clostridium beijerinckii]MCI1623684.1 DEAD/DEAH box helicase [Clostridium beijerinckii]
MSKNTILNKINEKVAEFEKEDNVLIVLKGIPLGVVDEDNAGKIDLGQVIENKLQYLFLNIIGKRKYIVYEEFLTMFNLLVDQYKRIYILNNNIYLENYPINIEFSGDIRNGLINHYDDNGEDRDDEECYLGDIQEYVALYKGIKDINGYLLGAYYDEFISNNSKVEIVNLFEFVDENIKPIVIKNDDYFDIIEEADYIEFVRKVFDKPDEIYVRITNFQGDKNRLKEHIELLSYYWKDWTDIYFVQIRQNENEFEHREEYNNILKKYWGYNDFRTLPVYDISSIKTDEKKVISISQENIISNIVNEVENCDNGGKAFRDVFVTAPTGAGKSVMFQIPAIYLAEKYGLLTIVISPLIGLMNDQVKNLEVKNYRHAKTINSDMSPIVKQDIIDKVAEGEYHILYISPETLLSRSDVEQLIGKRTIGMIVIDEAHIVTTWGKQFRPDYWYLGEHIRKLRKKQLEHDEKRRSFVIATFTATAIYGGVEDMYTETIHSLQMLQPIPYLGYIKRNDIEIRIEHKQKEKDERSEYEYDKFNELAKVIQRSRITNKKTLIYFPTVGLIDRFYEYCAANKLYTLVTKYHGLLSKDEKQENYERFLKKEKLVMLATKAFGMGIDINDIELVVHFAPTGNVCDYVQEIGRAARKEGLKGEAYYNFNTRDFKHINRLHGLSTIQKYQLIEVIKKICDLYEGQQRKNKNDLTRKKNAMLVDAENFTYIFGTPVGDESNNINKVKTALLMIQKDFENITGFSPIKVRPIPLFSIGFFKIERNVQKLILKKYPECLEEIDENKNICRLLLDKIWRKDYNNHSFAQFKYLLYSSDTKLDFNKQFTVTSALCVDVKLSDEYNSIFLNVWNSLKKYINEKVLLSEHTEVEKISEALEKDNGINKYKAKSICEVIIASMDSYRKNFSKSMTPIAIEKSDKEGRRKYQFSVAVNSYFGWVENCFRNIISSIENGRLYLINDGTNKTKEFGVILGILESFDVLSFKMIGGANSQLYIYVNQIQSLKNILNNHNRYENKLLKMVSDRHKLSVEMLTFLYSNNFSNSELWDLIEDYFLGKIPDKVKRECSDINF